jgi:hypothetical protein
MNCLDNFTLFSKGLSQFLAPKEQRRLVFRSWNKISRAVGFENQIFEAFFFFYELFVAERFQLRHGRHFYSATITERWFPFNQGTLYTISSVRK